MNLYRVSLKRIYEMFYVEASSFDEASEKVLTHLKLNEQEKYEVNESGLVKLIQEKEEERSCFINEITLVSSLIIR